jgi:hypothetical protein
MTTSPDGPRDPDPTPSARLSLATDELMRRHPPRWENANKRVVFGISTPAGAVHRGTVQVTRWDAMPLPTEVDPGRAAALLQVEPGFFDYAPSVPPLVPWYVNFADPHVFAFYGGSLFAQDEMQCAEHPVLGAVRHALEAEGIPPLTVERGKATPVLVMGAERRCVVATNPDAGAGRPHGLYGNAFSRASVEAIRKATRALDPPTVSNILAIAALGGGLGPYSRVQIGHTLVTAFSGFRAAVLESRRLDLAAEVAIHTGWWGCGAFGGNRPLMVVLQLLAAQMAGVKALVFHTGSPGPQHTLDEARAELGRLEAETSVGRVIDVLVARGFEWGESDGN